MTEAEFRERVRACLEELDDASDVMRLWPRVWAYIKRGLAEEAATGGDAWPGPS